MPSRRSSVDGGVSEGRAATSVCCTDLQHSCLPPSGTTTTTTTTGTDTDTQDTLPAAQDGSSGRQTRRTCPAADAVSTVASVRGEQPRLCAAQTCSTLACRRVAPPPPPPTGTDTNTQDTLPAAQDGSSGRQTRRTCPATDAVSTVASVRGEQPRLCAAQTCSTLACRRVAPPPPPPPGTDANTQDTLPAAQDGSSGRQTRRTCPAADAVSTVASVRGEQPRLCAAQTCSTLACRRVAPPPPPPTGTDTDTQDTLPAAQDGSSGRQTRRTCPAADAVSTVASVRGEQPRLCAAQTCSTLACRRVAPPPPPPVALTPTPRTHCRQLRTAAQDGRRDTRAQPPMQCRRWRQ